jgi:hypothetical protein
MENRIVSFTPRESDKIHANRKEKTGLYREYALLDLDDDGRAAVTLRIYWPGSVAHACVWINAGSGLYARGAGRAGGGGYCKASAAAGAALVDAGVTLDQDIDGRGLEAIRGALEAFARWVDIPRYVVHVAHA